jgi:uncharacterized Zn finger protein (UPF0148 family)
MLTATCRNCGTPKDRANYGDNYCPTCTTVQREREQGFAAENPEASQSDIIRAGKTALAERAHTAHRNFVDPRAFSSTRGIMPTRPEGR